ncbi:hypothetical protein GGR28_001288 [Lewinella aquimaris]|uniref:Uncharacterized protein n=1 Tax=Neolewinella aquimaris TaxID=1835722 RepID=A0A840E4U5_9BACT|nr:hypothetical protein [Neolewinella aquimaris]MBB4078675.1 hypothetical protein [Neolewinella aquimaris]
MVETLIHSTLNALAQPANRKNGIQKAILEFLRPAFSDEEEYATISADPTDEEAVDLIHERLDDYLTGEPDRIEKLEDILDRQDGL